MWRALGALYGFLVLGSGYLGFRFWISGLGELRCNSSGLQSIGSFIITNPIVKVPKYKYIILGPKTRLVD